MWMDGDDEVVAIDAYGEMNPAALPVHTQRSAWKKSAKGEACDGQIDC